MSFTMYHKSEPDAERRSCADCRYCVAHLSWWCVNSKAIKYRGTSLPGVHGCHFWAPGRRYPQAPNVSGWIGRLKAWAARCGVRASPFSIVVE